MDAGDENDAFPNDSPPDYLEDAMPGAVPVGRAQAAAGGATRYTGKLEKWRSLDPRYQVSRILGQGSYGQVAEALDCSMYERVLNIFSINLVRNRKMSSAGVTRRWR